MKLVVVISFVSIALLGLLQAGCEPANLPRTALPKVDNGAQTLLCDEYAPKKIDILPLTVFEVPHGEAKMHVVAYVSMLDSAGFQIKFPAKFRFELYQHVPRSSESKGRRVEIWTEEKADDPNAPKIHWFDLTDPTQNNRYWRDFIRAYSFDLPFKPVPNSSYILEATCLTHDSRRLTAEIALRQLK